MSKHELTPDQMREVFANGGSVMMGGTHYGTVEALPKHIKTEILSPKLESPEAIQEEIARLQAQLKPAEAEKPVKKLS